MMGWERTLTSEWSGWSRYEAARVASEEGER